MLLVRQHKAPTVAGTVWKDCKEKDCKYKYHRDSDCACHEYHFMLSAFGKSCRCGCHPPLAPASGATPKITRRVYLSHEDAANAGHEWDMVRQTTAYTCYGCRICEVKP